MKKLKYISILAIFAILSVVSTRAQQTDGSSKQSPDSCLIIWHKNGSQVMLKLNGSPKIEYIGDSVIVKSSETLKYGFKDIRKMTYVLKSPIIGDANDDGKVDEKDIVDIANYTMGKPTSTGKFNKMTADVNEDGVVNIADVVQIVNNIIGNQQ